jgi:predicted transcriptional regulator
MARPRLPRPTDGELAILNVIWVNSESRGGTTVRKVRDELGVRRSRNSVQTLMDIMVEKNLLRRDESVRPMLYIPVTAPDQLRRGLVKDLIDRAFGGSFSRLVVGYLSGTKATPSERENVRKLLDRLERKGAKSR